MEQDVDVIGGTNLDDNYDKKRGTMKSTAQEAQILLELLVRKLLLLAYYMISS